MINEGYLRRHINSQGSNREIALLDVAQEYILEHLRRQQLFDDILVFKGGTALRKYVFGMDGRFSVDLDFGARENSTVWADLLLDALDNVTIHDVHVELEDRYPTGAKLRISTPHGPLTEPAAVSIRLQPSWLPPVMRTPKPFDDLDRGIAHEFCRASLPVLDLREIAAEKIAAFWRRRKARDLYDLEHLGRVMQGTFDGSVIAELGALKIYTDVVEDQLGQAPSSPSTIFGCAPSDINGAEDLGRFRARETNVSQLLSQCATRYSALASIREELQQILVRCSRADRYRAKVLREDIIATIMLPTS